MCFVCYEAIFKPVINAYLFRWTAEPQTTVVNIAITISTVWSKVAVSVSEYELYFVYGHADRKVNDGITFEQSHFSKIHE